MPDTAVGPLGDELRPIVADATRGPELQAMVRSAVERLLEILGSDDFDAGVEFSNEELIRRVNAYAEAAADLGQSVALIGFWAPPSVARVGVDAIAHVAGTFDRTNGRTVWLDLYLYPATLLFYAYGLGALAGESHNNLARLFDHEVRDNRDEPRAAVEELNNAGALRHEVAQRLPGMERHHTLLVAQAIAVALPPEVPPRRQRRPAGTRMARAAGRPPRRSGAGLPAKRG